MSARGIGSSQGCLVEDSLGKWPYSKYIVPLQSEHGPARQTYCHMSRILLSALGDCEHDADRGKSQVGKP